jgi:hypothetical protein
VAEDLLSKRDNLSSNPSTSEEEEEEEEEEKGCGFPSKADSAKSPDPLNKIS